MPNNARPQARLATAVNTLTADLAATADARQFLAMYEAAIVARAATIAKEETDPGLDTGVLTGVGGGAALDKKGDDNGATAIADCSSSDMVPAPSNSDGGTAAAATGAAPRSTASPAKRARTAAPSPRRKRARPSASPRRPTAQPSPSRHPVSPSSQSQPSVSLLHPAHDTDTPDTADATAADDEHSSSAGVDAGPAGGSSGVTSGTHTTAAAPAAAPARRTTRAGSATTPDAVSAPPCACAMGRKCAASSSLFRTSRLINRDPSPGIHLPVYSLPHVISRPLSNRLHPPPCPACSRCSHG